MNDGLYFGLKYLKKKDEQLCTLQSEEWND